MPTRCHNLIRELRSQAMLSCNETGPETSEVNAASLSSCVVLCRSNRP